MIIITISATRRLRVALETLLQEDMRRAHYEVCSAVFSIRVELQLMDAQREQERIRADDGAVWSGSGTETETEVEIGRCLGLCLIDWLGRWTGRFQCPQKVSGVLDT